MIRAEVEQLVRDNGSEAKGGLGKNLTYLVTNSDEPTSK